MNEFDKKDEEIAYLVQSGQIELFSILVNRYEVKMTSYARRMLYNAEDVKDVVQDIFTKAFVYMNSFDKKRKFSSWLYRIAHNEIINAYKKNKRKGFLPLFDLDVFLPHHLNNDGDKISNDLEQKEMQEIISKCLNRIQDKYKEPLALYYLEGFSYKEIADIMHLPVSTVGIRIKRSKEIMKHILEKQEYNNHGHPR